LLTKAISSLYNRLIAFPLGKLAAYALPIQIVTLPRWLGGFSFSLNPGPFNIKVHISSRQSDTAAHLITMQEHVCMYMMANAAVFPTYAMNTIVVVE
jgi:hypothetical protein